MGSCTVTSLSVLGFLAGLSEHSLIVVGKRFMLDEEALAALNNAFRKAPAP